MTKNKLKKENSSKKDRNASKDNKRKSLSKLEKNNKVNQPEIKNSLKTAKISHSKKNILSAKDSTKHKTKTKKNKPLKEKKERKRKKEKNKAKIKTVVKKSLRTAKKKNAPIKMHFLIATMLLSLLVIGLILFVLLDQDTRKNKLSPTPTPHKLSMIDNYTTFNKIKNVLLQNALETDNEVLPTDCLESSPFNTPPNKIIYPYNKFIVILKRGKLFTTSTATNKFISFTEISPYPTKENNAITYRGLVLKDDHTIIVTGYRKETQSLEISTFLINNLGKITRGETYNIPTLNCNFDTSLIDDNFIIYTSRTLKPETSFSDINILNKWSTKNKSFAPEQLSTSTTFYDNASHLDLPTIHSLTTCRFQQNAFINCEQRHLLGDQSSGSYLGKKNFHLWTTQLPKNSSLPNKDTPNSKLYQFNLENSTIKLAQVVGKPITKESLSMTNPNELSALIYQNNTISPSWQTNFTTNKVARFKLNTNEFSTKGSFVNSIDNYKLTSINFQDIVDNSEQIITTDPALITLNKSTIIIRSDEGGAKSITFEGQILNIKKLSPQKIIVVLQKNTSIFAQMINIKNIIVSEPFLLQKNISIPPSIEISSVKKNNLISVALIEESLNKGQLLLLDATTNSLKLLNTISFNKQYQRTLDGCQNDCQQSWGNQAKYFILSQSKNTNRINNFIYAIVGSKLKKFVVNQDKTLRLIKTIDYTYKPAPPKPKLPRARIPGGAKLVNGKYVCKKKHDYVGKSKKNNKGRLHLDLECCLDPDEYPNPWCTYRPGELNVTKLRYKDYHGNVKVKKH